MCEMSDNLMKAPKEETADSWADEGENNWRNAIFPLNVPARQVVTSAGFHSHMQRARTIAHGPPETELVPTSSRFFATRPGVGEEDAACFMFPII